MPREVTMKLDSANLAGVLKDLNRIREIYSDPKWRLKVLVGGGEEVADAARPKVPKFTPVGKKKKRNWHWFSSKGSRFRVIGGNLRLSLRAFKGRRGKARELVYVGPKVKRKKTPGTVGRNRGNAHAVYSHMIPGFTKNAAEFRRKAMEPALAQKEGRIIGLIRTAIRNRTGLAGRRARYIETSR